MNEQQAYSQQIEKLSPQQGDLLVITIPQVLSIDQRERATALAEMQAERLGVRTLLLDGGANAQLQPSMVELLAEMQKQTSLLQTIADQNLAVIDALADEADDDQDRQPTHYLDGTPCQ